MVFADIPGMHVLLVDDDATVRAGYKRLLEAAGFSVETAENGLAALAVVGRRRPDAIVCDIRMAFLEGRQFYHELASEYPKLVQRVVFVTGAIDDPDIQAFADESGRPVLAKPVDADDLVATVRRVAG